MFYFSVHPIYIFYLYIYYGFIMMISVAQSLIQQTVILGNLMLLFYECVFIDILVYCLQIYICGNGTVIMIDAFIAVLNTFCDCMYEQNTGVGCQQRTDLSLTSCIQQQ